MAAFSSPLRLAPPMTPRRAPSPTMSPGGRRGRLHGISEEGRLRDLSPETTLRAFTQRPIPFDTSCDEYKIFSCIESLTAAERDLGARVAKAAQRLKSWCSEIEQWGWSGSFEQPSHEYREKRRRSLELRIREHVGDADLTNSLPPLEYWGSLLSVEVESHEARLDDIEEEMLKLDVEELKEHVLDMHPTGRSRPSSAGFDASRQSYKPMDDFSFLITQTLLSALPAHAQLKERLNTWTARISTLREVPRYLDNLSTAQKAMRLGWNAIDPPADTSDAAFAQWKEAVDTISNVLGNKVTDLGKRLDMMLDTLEGRDDCIPDNWIDIFEGIETDYGRWARESRRKVIDFDVRRKWENKGAVDQIGTGTVNQADLLTGEATTQKTIGTSTTEQTAYAEHSNSAPHKESGVVAKILTSDKDVSTIEADELIPTTEAINPFVAAMIQPDFIADSGLDSTSAVDPQSVSFGKIAQNAGLESNTELHSTSLADPQSVVVVPSVESPSVGGIWAGTHSRDSTPSKRPWFMADAITQSTNNEQLDTNQFDTFTASSPVTKAPESWHNVSILGENPMLHEQSPKLVSSIIDEESEYEEGDTVVHNDDEEEPEFDEGDTVVHNDFDNSPEVATLEHPQSQIFQDGHGSVDEKTNEVVRFRRRPSNLADIPTITTNDDQDGIMQEPPQTPRSRRDSEGSISSNMSFESSPPNFIEDSPSVRNATNRSVRAPRPELNAAMAKRRLGKSTNDNSIVSAPWPPTQFSQKASAEDLERKISDILTTIPAHIRLTSGPGADAPEVQPTRGLAAKGSRAYLRAARSVSGLKSPALTLSPAKNDFDNAASGRKSAAATRTDNDIKLYHLTQPGKEQPVKLFIRRVGENGERVMVRVGGGWADLGEYLRQYAEHHGRRTASDGKFEILGLEVKNNDIQNSPNRPESAMSKKDRCFSTGRPSGSPLTTPTKPNISASDTVPPMPNFASSTPGTAEESFVPSTNSSRRSWAGDEVGLSGPKAKKLDLSGEKLEWIEGMMKQARTVSGSIMPANHTPHQREERNDSRSESRSDSRAGGKKPEFGDLGKVGGTKRIFLKGGKPVVE
jgi:hypothetical protein